MKLKLLIIALVSLTSFALAAEDDKKGKKKADPTKRAEMILKNSDTDGNGTVSKAEFANSKMGKKMTEKRGADAVDKAFARMDKDKDGELSKAELTQMGGGKEKKPGKKKGDAK